MPVYVDGADAGLPVRLQDGLGIGCLGALEGRGNVGSRLLVDRVLSASLVLEPWLLARARVVSGRGSLRDRHVSCTVDVIGHWSLHGFHWARGGVATSKRDGDLRGVCVVLIGLNQSADGAAGDAHEDEDNADKNNDDGEEGVDRVEVYCLLLLRRLAGHLLDHDL